MFVSRLRSSGSWNQWRKVINWSRNRKYCWEIYGQNGKWSWSCCWLVWFCCEKELGWCWEESCLSVTDWIAVVMYVWPRWRMTWQQTFTLDVGSVWRRDCLQIELWEETWGSCVREIWISWYLKLVVDAIWCEHGILVIWLRCNNWWRWFSKVR